MKPSDLNNSLQPQRDSTSLASRSALVVFCLVAGLGYRIIIGLLPPSVLQLGVLLALSVLFLLAGCLHEKTAESEPVLGDSPCVFYLYYRRYPGRFEFLRVPSTDVRIEYSTRGSKCG